MQRLIPIAVIAVAIIVVTVIMQLRKTERCSTALERSYLNEQWGYSCPIDSGVVRDGGSHAPWPEPIRSK